MKLDKYGRPQSNKPFFAEKGAKGYGLSVNPILSLALIEEAQRNATKAKIHYNSGLHLSFNDRIFGALDRITIKTCKAASVALLKADVRTWDLKEIIESLEQGFTPRSCRLKFRIN